MADIVRDVFLAFARVHLLHHAAEKPIYGMEMMEELGRHGYRLSPGTLYPIFAGLVDAGFLRSDPVVVEGKVRKYYSITPGGRKALAKFKEKIRELVGEALYGEAEQQGQAKTQSKAKMQSKAKTGLKRTDRRVTARRQS
jgi:PadR family transcriptional regulator PadR